MISTERIEVHGAVQGVGFRPHVFRLATELGIRGDVRNVGGHLVIYAVEVADVRFGTGLSPAVAASVTPLLAAVRAELG